MSGLQMHIILSYLNRSLNKENIYAPNITKVIVLGRKILNKKIPHTISHTLFD